MGHVIPIIYENQNDIEAASGTIERPQSQPYSEIDGLNTNYQKKNSLTLSPNSGRGLHQDSNINEIHEEDEEEEDEEIIPHRGNSFNQRAAAKH